jgi:hypothetical protein
MPKIMAERLGGPALKAFKGSYPRFAATVDDKGVPNVVPLLSAVAADEETLIFARFMIWKTAKNIEKNRRITINSIGPGFKSWTLEGEFIEYQTRGQYIEFFNNQALYRYNAYMGINQVGVIRVRGVYEPWPISFVPSLWKFSRLRNPATDLASAQGQKASQQASSLMLPGQVLDKFNRRLALKYISFVNQDGHPFLLPDFTLRLSQEGLLLFAPYPHGHPLSQLNEGMKIASSVLTLGPVAYQVKGVYKGRQETGNASASVVNVEEVYTASPPVPGKLVMSCKA